MSDQRNDYGHRRIDEANLAYHRAVADHLRSHPEMVRQALAIMDRWEQLRGPQPYYETWRRLLVELPVGDLAEVITADDEHGRALRQSTPFVGVLSEEERLRILRGS